MAGDFSAGGAWRHAVNKAGFTCHRKVRPKLASDGRAGVRLPQDQEWFKLHSLAQGQPGPFCRPQRSVCPPARLWFAWQCAQGLELDTQS